MRYIPLSDVHANLPALEAVLYDASLRVGIDATYHLGDLVGHAPWPNGVVDRITDVSPAPASPASPASPGTSIPQSQRDTR